MSPGRRSGPPPWWPEGEPWHGGPPWGAWHGGHGGPRGGPPWRTAGPRHFRRRFLVAAATVLVVMIGLGILSNAVFGGRNWRDDESSRQDRNPIALVGFAGVVLLIGGAGATLAYRRLSRPVGDLLGAADQVAGGDFDVTVEPGGPRELRSLAHAFNRMAERLGDTDEQRRRFLADVSHELRTPLAVLQSGIEAQLDGIHARDDQHLASLLEETRRLGHLVDDLHTLALADAGQLVLHREPTDLPALVEEAIDGHRHLAERTQVTLRGPARVAASAAAGALPLLDVDPTRIRQVLDNLLSNAVRHTPAGGTVTVAVEPGVDAVLVAVSDAGPGFPPDQLAHVFERFTRPVDSRGSGLGLSIVRDLVEAHGGRIEATNRPEGGARVAFTLPMSTL
ncbi:MAG TPA: ATP-binding protein [Acidimicrobiales bacterium]|nr:ATP-binding protein [Acidimicrobiales bacterium]